MPQDLTISDTSLIPKCANCRFYKDQGKGVMQGKMGVCEVFPPDMVWNGTVVVPYWKQVKASEWCGQWEGKLHDE